MSIIVKHCKIHGDLTIKQVRVRATNYKQRNGKPYKYIGKRCRQCDVLVTTAYRLRHKERFLQQRRERAYKLKIADPKAYKEKHLEKWKRQKNKLAKSYIVKLMRCRGFLDDEMTPELIDAVRVMVKIKRVLKERNK